MNTTKKLISIIALVSIVSCAISAVILMRTYTTSPNQTIQATTYKRIALNVSYTYNRTILSPTTERDYDIITVRNNSTTYAYNVTVTDGDFNLLAKYDELSPSQTETFSINLEYCFVYIPLHAYGYIATP